MSKYGNGKNDSVNESIDNPKWPSSPLPSLLLSLLSSIHSYLFLKSDSIISFYSLLTKWIPPSFFLPTSPSLSLCKAIPSLSLDSPRFPSTHSIEKTHYEILHPSHSTVDSKRKGVKKRASDGSLFTFFAEVIHRFCRREWHQTEIYCDRMHKFSLNLVQSSLSIHSICASLCWSHSLWSLINLHHSSIQSFVRSPPLFSPFSFISQITLVTLIFHMGSPFHSFI